MGEFVDVVSDHTFRHIKVFASFRAPDRDFRKPLENGYPQGYLVARVKRRPQPCRASSAARLEEIFSVISGAEPLHNRSPYSSATGRRRYFGQSVVRSLAHLHQQFDGLCQDRQRLGRALVVYSHGVLCQDGVVP